MAHVLYVQASPRGDESFSIRAARAFLEAYAEAHRDDEVETLDLVATPPLEFRAQAAGAKMAVLADAEPAGQEVREWERVRQTIDHLKRADKLVISSPMWNFSIPYHLKHYIDVITQPRQTFRYTGPNQAEGLMKGRPVMLILARGGKYPAGTEAAANDRQLPYLEMILGFMGFGPIDHVLVEPTVAGGPEAAEKALEAARKEARKKAARF